MFPPCFNDPPPYGGQGAAPFSTLPDVEFGFGARTFADKTLCRVGRAWRGRVALG